MNEAIDERPPLVVTHGNCIDGFAAAWVMQKAMPHAHILPAIYGKPPPELDLFSNRDVYVVDFSFPRDVMKQISARANSLTVYDHHDSAEQALAGLEDELKSEGQKAWIVFDQTRSGAGIAWDETFPGPRPWLVSYVEDRDLWNWRFRNSHEVNAYVATVEHRLDKFDELHAVDVEDAMALGAGVLAYLKEYSRCVLMDARDTYFHGHRSAVVNAHYKSISEVLNYALEDSHKVKIAIGWYQRADGLFQYSLRSRGDGPRVNDIAALHGGGGHPTSAGFTSERLLEFWKEGERSP